METNLTLKTRDRQVKSKITDLNTTMYYAYGIAISWSGAPNSSDYDRATRAMKDFYINTTLLHERKTETVSNVLTQVASRPAPDGEGGGAVPMS